MGRFSSLSLSLLSFGVVCHLKVKWRSPLENLRHVGIIPQRVRTESSEHTHTEDYHTHIKHNPSCTLMKICLNKALHLLSFPQLSHESTSILTCK